MHRGKMPYAGASSDVASPDCLRLQSRLNVFVMIASVLMDRLWELALDGDVDSIRSETERYLLTQPDTVKARAHELEQAWIEKIETPEVGGYASSEPERVAFEEARSVVAQYL